MGKRQELIDAVQAQPEGSMERTEALEAWFEHTKGEALGIEILAFRADEEEGDEWGEVEVPLTPKAMEAMKNHVISHLDYVMERDCEQAQDEMPECYFTVAAGE